MKQIYGGVSGLSEVKVAGLLFLGFPLYFGGKGWGKETPATNGKFSFRIGISDQLHGTSA